ncbi:MAG TPA: hypothetical protein VFS43_05375 [Polyangiaceae bacterium]|nr:hypothetical protein [Polyangiaceae bacterium]
MNERETGVWAGRAARGGRGGGRRALAAGAALLAAASVAPPCRAQANHRPTTLGGRSILMGGTGVALARDASAPFLNPATMVRIADRRVAFSINAYALSVVNLSEWYRPRQPYLSGVGAVPGRRTTAQDIAFDDLPSTLCVFLLDPPRGPEAAGGAAPAADTGSGHARPPRAPAGAKKLAVCFGNADRRDFGLYDDERQAGGGAVSLQTSSTIHRWRRYVLGPSFAYALSDEFVVGASAYAQYGVFRGLWSTNVWADDGAGGAAVTSFDHLARGREFALVGSVGATYRQGDVTLGLSIAPPTLSIAGTASAHHFVRDARDQTLAWRGSGSFSTALPWRAVLGAGFERGRTTYELDLGLSAPTRRAYRARLEGDVAAGGGLSGSLPFARSDSERARPVVNLSAGVEHFVGPSLSLLGGVGTDVSAVPPDALDRDHPFPFFTDRTSRVTFSLGVGSYGAGGELLGGFAFDYGWGSRLGVDAFSDSPDFAVARQRSYSVLFVLSGSQSVRALRRAIEDVQKVVGRK